MSHTQKEYAAKYIEHGFQPIPLSRKGDGKGCFIDEWEKTQFKPNDFKDNHNIGLNLELSKLNNLDPDSENARILSSKFLPPTSTLGLRQFDGKKKIEGTSYFYTGKAVPNIHSASRQYPNKGGTIAELRGIGNIVVEPSVAQSRFFNYGLAERYWMNTLKPVENNDLLKQFNKICVGSVLMDYIKSFNMPVVKLTACLKRYCVEMGHWSEEELYDFVEKVLFSIKVKDKKDLDERKKWKSKIKTVLKNWDGKEDSKQSGYKSFAEHVGLHDGYAREMFTWIGEIPKQGTENDRKTVVDFHSAAMTEEDFHREIKRTYLAEGIICDVGLYVVAGRPKQGKSRILKDLAYKTVNGGKWLGREVSTGDALLLALEDSKDSMNLDIKQMHLQFQKKPTTFVEQCPTLDRGFVESIELWHSKVPHPKLVIIDTFQKIKPLGQQKTRNANAYEVDYHYLTMLHDLAKRLKLCIIYVHHLSQADKSHSWDKIMGSTGHQGCTDAMYMLEREETGYKGTFKGIGRNIPSFQFDIEWNTNRDEPFTFQYSGDTYVKRTAEHKRNIIAALRQLHLDGQPDARPSDVYKVLNLVTNKDKAACAKNMQRMREKFDLKDGEKHGTYKLTLNPECYDKNGEIKKDEIPY